MVYHCLQNWFAPSAKNWRMKRLCSPVVQQLCVKAARRENSLRTRPSAPCVTILLTLRTSYHIAFSEIRSTSSCLSLATSADRGPAPSDRDLQEEPRHQALRLLPHQHQHLHLASRDHLLLQGQPRHSHASRINQREQYYDSQKRLEYSRSVDWGHRDYGRARPYISPSDDPLAAFQAAMAKMDYEKERSRKRPSYYSPPRAYRKHRSYRRERLERDIPPESKEEMEQRLEFERNLRRREEQRKASGNSRKFKGEGDSRDREGSVESNETMKRETVEETDRWEEEKPARGKTGDDEDKVRVGDSTPTLSPETSESRDEEGKDEFHDEILGYNETDMKQSCVEAEMKKINEPFAVKEVGSDESHADDHEESSETDSVKEEKEPRRINWEMEQAKSSGGELEQLEQLGQLDEEVQRHLSSWQEVQSLERNISGGMKACENPESDRNGIEIVEGEGDGPEEDVYEQRQQESSSESEVEGSSSGLRLSGKELETYGEEIENDGREERIESSSGALREKKKKAKKDKKVGKKSKRAKKEKKKKAKKDKKRTKKCNESEPQESALSSEDETKKKRKRQCQPLRPTQVLRRK